MHFYQDIKSCESLQNKFAILMMIIHSKRQIREGKVTGQKQLFNSIEKRYFN